MDKAGIYTKKILALLLCVVLFYLSLKWVKFYYSLPVIFLAYSLLSFKITSVKPRYLFNYKRSEEYLNKGGLRSALRILITPLGVLNDIIVWTLWGCYLVFDVIIDLFLLIDIITYWFTYGILWILKLYVPPLIVLFNSVIHYLIKWPWWIYRTAAENFKYTFNINYVIVSLWGSIAGLFLIFIFYFLEFILDVKGLIFIGAILSLASVSWSLGEIASIKQKNIQGKKYGEIRMNFQNGSDTLRSTLLYITLFIFFIIIQFVFNISGWINSAGLTFTSITITVNTFINMLIIFLTIIIVLGTMISPSYRLNNSIKEVGIRDSFLMLKDIIVKLPKYVMTIIPGTILGGIGLILPLVFLALSFFITNSVKDFVIDLKINNLKQKQADTQSEVRSYELSNQIKLISYAKKPPTEFVQDMMHRKNLEYELKLYKEDLHSLEEESVTYEQEKRTLIIDINNKLDVAEDEMNIAELNYRKGLMQNAIEQMKARNEIVIRKRKADIYYLERQKKQLPALFFFWGIWGVVFIGFVLSFLLSYLGNVFYDVYHLKEDHVPSYFAGQLKEQNIKDAKQPLIGFSLLIFTIGLIIFLYFHFRNITITIPLKEWFFQLQINPRS